MGTYYMDSNKEVIKDHLDVASLDEFGQCVKFAGPQEHEYMKCPTNGGKSGSATQETRWTN